ncbi:hypothetical protein [Streptomyces sp. UNOB3_S3]|uniref:hypothetical protein n=1 Tax=Streptomyces sp. UNOB3_S3 TaxID=2871682 RepID=UPI001E636061|nr:hypothetical protein [Streptomyces sp. UNOB3_S3]MCC3775432.1 hypothetical protein [Streptomyces sp. UNOB3_S3]
MAHRTLWRLLAESDVRIGELLNLNVRDLALDDQVIHIAESKEGPKEVGITERAAVDLRQLVGERREGPVFLGLTGSRLTSSRAAETFWTVTGKSMHVLRYGRQDRQRPTGRAHAAHSPPNPRARELTDTPWL